MARFNEILAGRYNRFLQKLFSMKGGPPAPQLASEVAMVMKLFSGVENRFLESWFRYAAFASVPAQGAGNKGALAIRNPVGSNVVVVIEKFNGINNSAAQDFYALQLQANATDYANTVSTQNLDGRQAPTVAPTPTSRVSFGIVANLLSIASIGLPIGISADFINFEEQEIVLAPGFQLQVVQNQVNASMSGSIFWRERALEESERT